MHVYTICHPGWRVSCVFFCSPPPGAAWLMSVFSVKPVWPLLAQAGQPCCCCCGAQAARARLGRQSLDTLSCGHSVSRARADNTRRALVTPANTSIGPRVPVSHCVTSASAWAHRSGQEKANICVVDRFGGFYFPFFGSDSEQLTFCEEHQNRSKNFEDVRS